MFGKLGLQEILILFIIIAVLFIPKRLPGLGKDLGEGIRNFRKSFREIRGAKDDLEKEEAHDQ